MNYSRNWNKILELSNGKVDEIASNRFIGEPLNVLRDYIHTDVITDKGVTMHTKDGDIHYTLQELYAKYGSKYKWYEGQIAVNDWNNDGKITDEDKRIYGCTDPKWVGSLSSNMYYKGFDFSVMIYTKQGQWARSYFHDKYMKWSDRGNQHMAMDFFIFLKGRLLLTILPVILYMPLKLITVNILIRIIPILRQVDIFLIKVARREKAFSIRRLLL